jgi:hypothetical protein
VEERNYSSLYIEKFNAIIFLTEFGRKEKWVGTPLDYRPKTAFAHASQGKRETGNTGVMLLHFHMT